MRIKLGGRTPLETVKLLLEAINEGDVERAVSLDESDAASVVEPGKMPIGIEAIARRASLGGHRSRPQGSWCPTGEVSKMNVED